MNTRRLGLALVALALFLAGLWVWRSGTHSTTPAVQTAERVAQLEPSAPTTLTPPSPNEDRAPIAPPAEVVAAKPAAFGLIRVLVRDKTSSQPLRDARVTATHETVEQSHHIHNASGTRGKPFESIRTGADGRVEIETPPGVEVRLNASGREIEAGFAEAIVPALAAGEQREIALELPTADDLPFWMKLVEEKTLVPIP